MIQRPPPKDLGIRYLCFVEEVFRVMLEFAAEPSVRSSVRRCQTELVRLEVVGGRNPILNMKLSLFNKAVINMTRRPSG